MLNLLYFISIYSVLLFVWSYVFANLRRKDKVNASFLIFLTAVLIWMVISQVQHLLKPGKINFIVQSVYWIVLLNFATFFMYFVYQLLERRLDRPYYFIFSLNTMTLFLRYTLPMDYSQVYFWRFEDVFLGTVMSTVFMLPALWSIWLLIRQYVKNANLQIRRQLKLVLTGVTLACFISYLSEYILPIFFPQLSGYSLMYVAILVLVVFLLAAITRQKFLNVEMEYIYEELFLHSSMGIVLVDKKGCILCINQAAKDIFMEQDIVKGMEMKAFIEAYRYDWNCTNQEVLLQTAQGSRTVILSQEEIKSNRKVIGKLVHLVDVTEERHHVEEEKNRLIHITRQDDLTSVYNKRFFSDLITKEASGQVRHRAVLFLDLDNFKEINDYHGHLIGDQAISLIARCIKEVLDGRGEIIRYGGDEFILLMEPMEIEQLVALGESIQFCVGQRVEVTDREPITLSIGISQGRDTLESIVDQADQAMYYSKLHGKNRLTVYDSKVASFFKDKQMSRKRFA